MQNLYREKYKKESESLSNEKNRFDFWKVHFLLSLMSEFQEIRDILKEVALAQASNEKGFKELRETQAKSEAKSEKEFEKLRVSQAKTEKEIRITTKTLKKVSKMFGNSERNKGLIIEDIFYNSLNSNKVLNNIKYDYIVKNLELKIGKEKKGEIDIVLLNGSYIALIEIKSIANIKDFEQIDNYIESYKKIYPYEKRKVFIYYGSFCFDKSIKEQAKQKGYGLLSLNNKTIQIETENIKEFSL